ncbi:hypothetical protein N752_23590 [Desulforamulus aquiferis]|nr:hypothetical protein N752_23590 [Desulforamulus aquiferis]
MEALVVSAKQRIADLGRKMVSSGLVAGTWGNISVFIRQEGLVVVTPSGMDYDKIQAEDMVVVDLDGKLIEGSRKASSETPLHLAIYRARPDVTGVVHTHSEVASSFAVVRQRIEPVVEDAAMLVGGAVEVAEYALQVPRI